MYIYEYEFTNIRRMLISHMCKHRTYRLSMIANNDHYDYYISTLRHTVYKHRGEHKVRHAVVMAIISKYALL